MRGKIVFSILFLFLIPGNMLTSNDLNRAKAASVVGGKTLVLYDAGSGNIPNSTLMSFTAFPPDAASLRYSGGASILDTTLAGDDGYAGWVASGTSTSGFPVLDRMAGVQMNFTIQVESEIHTSNNRAGFSVIVLDREAKGIELSFWQNEIWTQSDDSTGGLFTHGEGVVFATTAGLIDYQVTFVGDTYTVTANAVPILNGPLRDYSNFEGFLDPYETPNFLFMGDDTTSAQTRVRLHFVSVTGTEPILPTSAVTSISTNPPQPTASPIPLPSAAPVPSPTPAGKVLEFCPSGWLLAVVMFGNVVFIKKIRQLTHHPI